MIEASDLWLVTSRSNDSKRELKKTEGRSFSFFFPSKKPSDWFATGGPHVVLADVPFHVDSAHAMETCHFQWGRSNTLCLVEAEKWSGMLLLTVCVVCLPGVLMVFIIRLHTRALYVCACFWADNRDGNVWERTVQHHRLLDLTCRYGNVMTTKAAQHLQGLSVFLLSCVTLRKRALGLSRLKRISSECNWRQSWRSGGGQEII